MQSLTNNSRLDDDSFIEAYSSKYVSKLNLNKSNAKEEEQIKESVFDYINSTSVPMTPQSKRDRIEYLELTTREEVVQHSRFRNSPIMSSKIHILEATLEKFELI